MYYIVMHTLKKHTFMEPLRSARLHSPQGFARLRSARGSARLSSTRPASGVRHERSGGRRNERRRHVPCGGGMSRRGTSGEGHERRRHERKGTRGGKTRSVTDSDTSSRRRFTMTCHRRDDVAARSRGECNV